MGRCSQSRDVILTRIQPRSIIMPIRNVAAGIGAGIDPLTQTGLLTANSRLPRGAVTGTPLSLAMRRRRALLGTAPGMSNV